MVFHVSLKDRGSRIRPASVKDVERGHAERRGNDGAKKAGQKEDRFGTRRKGSNRPGKPCSAANKRNYGTPASLQGEGEEAAKM